MMGRNIVFALVFSLVACGGVHYITEAPPEPQVEERGERPSPNQVWVPGHWRWFKARYTWMTGDWLKIRPDHRWVPAYWHQSAKGWRFHPGFWEKAH